MRREHLLCLALVVVTALVYGQVVGFEFVNFDDPGYVIDNPQVTGGVSAENIGWAFTSGYQANWHPATWLSLMLDAQLFGLNPAGYHATNLLLHVLNTVLLFWVLRRMTAAMWPSALVAALFALHPLHVESVAWVTERKDVLSLFWGLLSVWAYVAYCGSGRRSRYVLAAVCLAIGLMAKPLLITLPFVFLLLDYWPLDRVARQRATALLLEKVPFFLLVVASSVATYLAQSRQGAVAEDAVVSFALRLANAVVSYVRYLGKMFWPQDLSILYAHPNMPGGTPWAAWQVIGAALLLVAVSWLVWRYRQHRFLTVGWLLYLGTLVPMIGIVQVGTQAMADRYTYLPLIGIFVAIAWGGAAMVPRVDTGGRRQKPRKKPPGRTPLLGKVLAAVAVLALVVYAGVTRQQTRVWRDSLTLGFHAVAAGPTSPKIHYNLGLALSQAGRYDEAVPHYRDALRLKPDHAKAHNNLGKNLFQLGRHEEAIASCRRAIHIDPEFALAYVNLSAVLAAVNRLDDAIEARRAVARLEPDNAENHNNLGGLLAMTGHFDPAIDHFRRALALQPDFPQARRNLEQALALLQRDENKP